MGQGPLIAVIDDDASARSAARSLIGSLGFGVATFASVEAFLASEALETVACLVVEMRMTHMTGDTLPVRLSAAGRAVPTIVTTRIPQAASRRWRREAGIIACLDKPLEPESMLRALRAALTTDTAAP
jgi:FixJ family two-component response regulator